MRAGKPGLLWYLPPGQRATVRSVAAGRLLPRSGDSTASDGFAADAAVATGERSGCAVSSAESAVTNISAPWCRRVPRSRRSTSASNVDTTSRPSPPWCRSGPRTCFCKTSPRSPGMSPRSSVAIAGRTRKRAGWRSSPRRRACGHSFGCPDGRSGKAMTRGPPAGACRALLAPLDASEGRRGRRKRDTTPDAIGMSLKRQLLEQAVLSDPEPDCFEAWLLERCLSSETASTGALRAMAQEVLTEWRLTTTSVQFTDWLAAEAPSEDRTP